MKHLTTVSKTTSRTSMQGLITTRKELSAIIQEAKEQLDSINSVLLEKVNASEDKKLTVGNATISGVTRLSFSQVDLSIAKKYHATKTVVDTDILKPLYLKLGDKKIPGVSSSQYVVVKEA